MPTTGHKRKRSLQDSPVDPNLMYRARKCLAALQEELDGVEETSNEMEAIMTQVDALQAILGTAKEPGEDHPVAFSHGIKGNLGAFRYGFRLCDTDLVNIGIQQKFLDFHDDKLQQLVTDKRLVHEEHILHLFTHIARVDRHVSMRARMIMDAILLSVAEICADSDSKLLVAILPELRIASGDGVLLQNPATSFEMRFTGAVDYVVCTCETDQQRVRLLKADVKLVGKLAKSCIFLIEGKRIQDKPFDDFMPEAIAQAAALCEISGMAAVRFCLTDGRKWMFSIFTKDKLGERVCYEGDELTILESRLDSDGRDSAWEESVHKIVELVYHWLVHEGDPLEDSLYKLKD